MPKTRSKTAQRSSNGDTDQQQSSEGTTTEASSATTTTTTATTTTEGNTDRTTTTDTSTENRAKHHKHIQTTSRFRSHQQTLRTPDRTAAARLAALETEETDSEEENTVVQDQETQKSRKLGGHSDGNPRHYRRTASEKRNDGAKQQNTDELATAAKIDTPPAVCATSTRPASETEQKKQTEIPTAVHATETSPTQHSRPEHIAPLQSTGNMITELATALTRRAGPSSATYQRFMAHIKNGSCSKHPTSTHARRSPNTKTC
ncbi:hypothetical protein EVAR_88206_1 [Eumeta japonica]|uniref:Uncharacterized protein n=1 Tax=Eumeta variegata TaxID=151549 RepID=A0A4C1SR44_EUMVA|nr:hypothetical protein EVAR_88206_1 [Eumeta japonica]